MNKEMMGCGWVNFSSMNEWMWIKLKKIDKAMKRNRQ
jgi:hypothetical protein